MNADRDALERTIATLEGQRAVLGDAAVQLALAPIRARLSELDGGAAVPLGVPAQQAERKVVTVIFVDVSGFTAMSERLDAERVREIMNGCFDRLVPVIVRYGGVIDKFMGDGLMALFGVPQATEHHADHALRAGLDLFGAVREYNDERALSLGIHIGVNSGLVVAGGMGSVGRQNYSVVGDAVNVAARLEDASQIGEILVGPATHRLTTERFEFESLEPISLKGKAQRLPVYRLIGLRARQQHPVAEPNRVSMRIAGRNEELAALLDIAGRARLGEGAVIGVVGDPGLGKSTLVAELRSRVAGSMTWWEAGGQAHRSEVSHGLFQDLIEDMIDAPPGSDRGSLAGLLEDFLHDLLGDRARDVTPYMLRLCDLPVPPEAGPLLDDLSPEALRQRMWNAAAETFGAASRFRPTVVVFEDLHWADPSSIDLVRETVRYARSWPMLIVFTTRSNAARVLPLLDELARSNAGLVVNLKPLGEDVVRALMDELLVTSDRAPLLRDRLVAKAEGNPFYLVSFLRSLVDDGLGVIRGGRVEVDGPADDLDLPDSLHALVASRIDSVDVEAKQVLRLASVLGRSFSRGMLGRLMETESRRLEFDEILDRLVARQLLDSESSGNYKFSHAVVHEVAYRDMLATDRRRLHGSVARLLAADSVEATEQSVALLAWHHEHARQLRDASRCYEHAAELAQRTHANDEALSYLSAATRLADRDEADRILMLRERTGDLQHLVGRFEPAADQFSSILDEIPLDKDPATAARLMRKMARTFTPRQRAPDALAKLKEANAVLDRQPAQLRGNAWWNEHLESALELMWILYMNARSEELAALACTLEPELHAHGNATQRLSFHRNLILLELRQRRFRVGPATVARAGKVLDEVAAIDDQTVVTFAMFGHAFTLLWSGEIEQADIRLREVLAIATRIGDAERTVLCLTYLAVTARFRNNTDNARAFAVAAQSAARRNRSPMYDGVASANLAWVAWRRAEEDVTAHCDDATRLMATYASYPLQWLLKFVELARSLAGDRPDLPAAMATVQVMVQPSQQLLRADVQEALEAAASAESDRRLPALHDLVRAATYAGYL
jgi:class 3 adenylate cyclase